jgi:phosphoesterase RecJ-like protein
MLDWTPFVDLVKRHQRFLVTTHVRPDPDGLGSQRGLAGALEHLGKDVRMVIASAYPPRYDFLNPDKRIKRFAPPGDELRDVEVAIVVDTGTWNQLGDFGPFLKSLNAKKIVIDHHPTQDDLGAVRFVDTSAEASGRLVHEVIGALGVPLTPAVANYLFAAVATDTGWFRHSNTSAATFALAGKLEEAGANPTELYNIIYEKSTLPRKKLMGLVLDRLQVIVEGRGIVHSEIRRADYAATGAIPSDTEDLVNLLRGIGEVEVLFMEQPEGGIKVSFRSDRANVGKVAESFGGGGHRLASGAIVQGNLEDAKKRVLDAVIAALSHRA